MFDAINPLYWWGTAAVASPIIIHLINRLRYRRIRWAAIEFLLKSQKRNRRRLIIEQLLLLLLRCAAIILLALLVIRPLWLLGQDARTEAGLPTYHVLLIDDSLSMRDGAANEGTAFSEAIRIATELAQQSAESANTHYFTVISLSDAENPHVGRPLDQLGELPPGRQLDNTGVMEVRNRLTALECSFQRLELEPGLRAAIRYLANVDEGNKYLHVFSDFRRPDWQEGNSDTLARIIGTTAHSRGGGTRVLLHDTAHPIRGDVVNEPPPEHVNIGITDLVARLKDPEESPTSGVIESLPVRVVTPGIPVSLSATVKNFSTLEQSGLQLRVRIDGVERIEFSRTIQRLGAGQETVIDIPIRFIHQESLGLKQIALYLEEGDSQDRLPEDNVRYTYLELREEVPVLVVDPSPNEVGGDAYFISLVLRANADFGLRPEVIRPSEVKRQQNLDQYPVVFLLNIPGMGGGATKLDEPGLRALEGYAQRGGSIVFFLGPSVSPLSYNENFYKDGNGIFPIPLLPRPNPSQGRVDYILEPPDPQDIVPKLIVGRPDHPVMGFYTERTWLAYLLSINGYFRIDPDWQPGPQLEIVARMHNRQPLESYLRPAMDIAFELKNDSSNASGTLREYATRIETAVDQAETKRARKGELITVLTELLDDPVLSSYWAAAASLKDKTFDLLTTIQSGEPLVLEAPIGGGAKPGRALVFLTTAAPTPVRGRGFGWNNWASVIDPTEFVPYVPMILKSQQYMAAHSRAARETPLNHVLGQIAVLNLNKQRYDNRAEVWRVPPVPAQPKMIEDLRGKEEEETLRLETRPTLPGFYLIKLNQPGPNGGQPKGPPEERPLAVNVHNREEGVLTRISERSLREKIVEALSRPASQGETEQLRLTPAESREFVEGHQWFATRLAQETIESTHNRSWSEYAWILLLFLGLLTLEQWLAMRLSYHVKDLV